MKKVYAKGAISMIACNNGFIFTALQNEIKDENKTVVSFKQHSFDTNATSLVTRNAYLLSKFGTHFEYFAQTLDDYFNCRTTFLPNYRLFITHPNGQAWIYDNQCNLKWEGNIRYKGFGPADVVVDGNYVWCSYPENNAVIKYNSTSMRQDFKVGGSALGGLNEPSGLWMLENKLIITSYANGDILSLDLDTFYIEKIEEFDEPIHQYFNINSNQVILTESGIYIL